MSKEWLVPAFEVQGNRILVIACKHSIQSYYNFQGLDTEKTLGLYTSLKLYSFGKNIALINGEND